MSKEYPNGIESDQIDNILLVIKAAWLRHPHLRLMQLLNVAMTLRYLTYPETIQVDEFYLEDSELVKSLEKY